MRPRHRTFISVLVGVLLLCVGYGKMGRGDVSLARLDFQIQQDVYLARAITKVRVHCQGSDIEKARFVFSRLPEIAKQYSFEAGGGGTISQGVIGAYRYLNPSSDPEATDN